jgi:hypothetical protein
VICPILYHLTGTKQRTIDIVSANIICIAIMIVVTVFVPQVISITELKWATKHTRRMFLLLPHRPGLAIMWTDMII